MRDGRKPALVLEVERGHPNAKSLGAFVISKQNPVIYQQNSPMNDATVG